jgi:hypothetical protein
MFIRAGRTSSHLRVLRPQSGLTQIWSAERCSLALSRSAAISSMLGRREQAMYVAIIDTVWNGVWQSMKIAATAEAHEVNVRIRADAR